MKDILKVATGVVIGLSIFSLFALMASKVYLNNFLFNDDAGMQVESDSTIPAGRWTQSTYSDPLYDTVTVSVYLEEEPDNLFDESPALYIRCKEDQTEAYIDWKAYIGDIPLVAFRFDDGEVIEREWDYSLIETATDYPGDPLEFINRIIGSERLVARLTMYSGSMTTAIFETAGLEEAIKPIRTACRW